MKNYNDTNVLGSERLYTRFLSEDDILKWSEFFMDKEAIQYFPENYFPELFTPIDSSSTWISRQMQRYRNNEFGLLALIDKQTNQLVGQCGLLTQRVNDRVELEVGYHVIKKYWGQGIAGEGSRIFINYAISNKLSDRLISIIDKRNIQSQRVAEKNGFRKDIEIKWHGLDAILFELPIKDEI